MLMRIRHQLLMFVQIWFVFCSCVWVVDHMRINTTSVFSGFALLVLFGETSIKNLFNKLVQKSQTWSRFHKTSLERAGLVVGPHKREKEVTVVD